MKILLMSIVWYIIGIGIALIIMAMAGGVAGLALLSDPRLLTNPLMFLNLIGGSILVFYFAMTIGGVISALGAMATFLKYSAELVAGEVNLTKPIVLSPQVPSARALSQPSKFCPTCGTQNVTRAGYCSKCGTGLQPLP